MIDKDDKAILQRYLQRGRDTMLWKLEGLSEYDVRRPMVPTATNLLGVVKHLASVEAGYFGETFGRPFPESLPWFDEAAELQADMWVTTDESRDYIIDLYQRVWAHSDETIQSLPLDAEGSVPWWPDDVNPITLHWGLVHMIAETDRHVGHADILRELIDGSVGNRPDRENLGFGDDADWSAFRDRVEAAARQAGGMDQ